MAYVSDGCGIVRNVLDGSKVTLIFPRRPSDIYQASYETVQDCLYLLTVPNPRVEYANVFVRFTAVNFEGILTSKVYPRTVRIQIFLMAVDP